MTVALCIKGLRKTYANGFEALQGIDLEVKQGDFFALLGPNGAGKSTTIGIISSLITKSAGAVQIFGKDPDTQYAEARCYLGIVPQEFNFNQFEKTFDILTTQAGYYGLPLKLARERAEKYLKKLSLWDKKDTPSRLLSGGMKRRLMIARAMVHEPKLLILDEPTAGVDIEIRRSMWDLMREVNEAGTTIILTTHYLEEAESLCRNIAIIDHGKIIENTDMKSLLQKQDKEVFILDVDRPLNTAPELNGYDTRLLDRKSFEVEVHKHKGINLMFSQLTEKNIQVVSMRNKANRLEELFITLVENGSCQ